MNPLDTLTRATTAFDTWAEFREHLARGYVPTIYPTCRRKRLLIRVLKAHGFTVWPRPRATLFFHGTPAGYGPNFE